MNATKERGNEDASSDPQSAISIGGHDYERRNKYVRVGLCGSDVRSVMMSERCRIYVEVVTCVGSQM